MYWEIVPTPQGCQLMVDGAPIGSPAEPPPSGWLQRQFGILMPLGYEHARLSCNPPSWTGRPGIDPVMYEPRAVAGSCPTPPRQPGDPDYTSADIHCAVYGTDQHPMDPAHPRWREGIPEGFRRGYEQGTRERQHEDACLAKAGVLSQVLPLSDVVRLFPKCASVFRSRGIAGKRSVAGSPVGVIDRSTGELRWEPGGQRARVQPSDQQREPQCRITYDGGVRRIDCDDGSHSINLYKLNEELDQAGWGTHEIEIPGSQQHRAALMAEVMEWWIASGQSGTNPPGQGSAFARIAQAYDRAHGFSGAERRPCPTREDYLPYCDPCTQPLCGDVIYPNCPVFGPDHPDCQRPPQTQVDPHARVDAFMQGYESQRSWMEAGGDGIAPRTWTTGCVLVWTYQAEHCPRGYHPVAWYPAPDGEDLALICCPGD